MLNLLIIGLGGFFGAVARALTNSLVAKLAPHSPALGTLCVNVLGSFAMGLLFAYAQNKGVSPLTKSLISTGFLGAFTTFSTFSYENFLLLQSGNFAHLALNILLNVALCLIAVILAFWLIKPVCSTLLYPPCQSPYLSYRY